MKLYVIYKYVKSVILLNKTVTKKIVRLKTHHSYQKNRHKIKLRKRKVWVIILKTRRYS